MCSPRESGGGTLPHIPSFLPFPSCPVLSVGTQSAGEARCGQGALGLGGALQSRVNTAMWTFLFPLWSCYCRSPISQSYVVGLWVSIQAPSHPHKGHISTASKADMLPLGPEYRLYHVWCHCLSLEALKKKKMGEINMGRRTAAECNRCEGPSVLLCFITSQCPCCAKECLGTLSRDVLVPAAAAGRSALVTHTLHLITQLAALTSCEICQVPIAELLPVLLLAAALQCELRLLHCTALTGAASQRVRGNK